MRRAIVPPGLQEAARVAGLSPALRAGDFIYFTGATGGRADGTMPADAADQAQVSLGKVIDILAELDATEADIVELTSYHIDIRQTFPSVEGVLRQVFSDPLPAWTAIGAAELRRPSALVEFRVVAYLPESDTNQDKGP